MTDDIAACPHSLAERETAVADGMCPICSADALSRRSTPPLPDEIAELIARNSNRIAVRVYGRSLLKDNIAALRAQAQEIERWKSIHRTSDVMHLEKTEFMLNQEERTRELETENDTLRNSVDAVRARYLQGVFDEKARADKLEAERDDLKKEFESERAACGEAYRQREELRAERDQYKDDYLRRHKDVGDQMDRRIKAEAERDAVQANLEQTSKWLQGAHLEMGRIRAKTIEECWNGINKYIKQGPLDEPAHSERNGLVMAANIIRALAQTDEGKTETGE